MNFQKWKYNIYTFRLEIITVIERNISIILDEIHKQER